jgi:hypothetical protein
MPVQDFYGNTFVAFTDISGFKEMMKDERRAVRALDRLNQVGFDSLRNNQSINGFFVSDCGILFVRNTELSKRDQLQVLLDVLQRINRELLQNDVMLTTSVSYGPFSYHQRIEFEGIEKNPIYGNAYVAAFLDNETGKPKIQPGQCRIIAERTDDINFDHFDRIQRKGSHFYYYWMVNTSHEIDGFIKDYKDSYKLKYQGMLSALKRNG